MPAALLGAQQWQQRLLQCDLVWFLLIQVLNLIKSCHVPEGMSLQDLKLQLHNMSMSTIK